MSSNSSMDVSLDEDLLYYSWENRSGFTEDNAFEFYIPDPQAMLSPWKVNPYLFPIVITYLITFTIGVSGNLLVILFMAADKTGRSGTTIFLVSLAISDLLFLTIYGPLEVGHYFVIQTDLEGTICKLAAYAESVSAFASVLNLVAVTFERFLVIVFPIHSRSLCTISNCKRLMVIVWLFSFIMAIPTVFIKHIQKYIYYNDETSVTMYLCKDKSNWETLAVSAYRVLCLFGIPSILMIGCYTWVIVELWISTKTMNELTQNAVNNDTQKTSSLNSISQNSSRPPNNRVILRSHVNSDHKDIKSARQQVIKMLILVVLLFLICWGPRLVMELIIKCGLNVFDRLIYSLRVVFYLLPFVHSCLNPVVYCFMSTKFRRKILESFQRMTSFVRRRQRVQQSSDFSEAYRMGQVSSVYTLTSVARSCYNSPNVQDK